ncbi:Rv3235 family protein [Rothia sp. P13129]|uniref:Rv3235 family protein n=1 Tax=unclassified Rothia (in: high G+C Gram-positive bacteria) TaxID=2689056 RepID=UPI003AD07469
MAIHQPESTPNQQRFTVISAEEYERFRQALAREENINFRPKRPISPSNEECKAIEIMCAGISVAILEVFAGRRPTQHIARWLSQECYQQVTQRAQLTQQLLRQHSMRTPLKPSPTSHRAKLPKARRAKAQKVRTDTFEVCLIMEDLARVRAIAMRVEKVFSKWKITALEIA